MSRLCSLPGDLRYRVAWFLRPRDTARLAEACEEHYGWTANDSVLLASAERVWLENQCSVVYVSLPSYPTANGRTAFVNCNEGVFELAYVRLELHAGAPGASLSVKKRSAAANVDSDMLSTPWDLSTAPTQRTANPRDDFAGTRGTSERQLHNGEALSVCITGSIPTTEVPREDYIDGMAAIIVERVHW